MQLGSILTRHAQYRPKQTAVIYENHQLTFAEFDEGVNRLANAFLGLEIKKGDRIACVLQNGLEILYLYWAAAKIGAVAVPLSPLLTGQGLSGLIAHSGATALVMDPEHAAQVDHFGGDRGAPRCVIVGGKKEGWISYEELVWAASPAEPPAVNIEDHDPLMIVYSSGTTGDPKGIVLSHYARAMYCTLYASAWRMTPESVSLHAGSLVFNGAFMTMLPSFFLGGTYVLHRQFESSDVIAAIKRQRVTHMVVVPSQLIMLLDNPTFTREALSSLEALISLGAPLHLHHKERVTKVLPHRFYEMYGLAEGFMTILDKADPTTKLGSVGTPPPFFDMRIIAENGGDVALGEIGEIIGRGPIMMTGYHNRPDLTKRAIPDGWLRSGDLGYVDRDGYLFLADRKKDMIKSGGVSVYPHDIEEIAVRHPAIREAAAFGVPHEKWGETPVVAVVLSDFSKVSADELKAWINANVSAKFQRVADVMIVEDLPRNAAGKTLKRTIQERYMAACKSLGRGAA